ncbi:MAG: tetratricopeptide repeat protein [Patescibacteria group bacterium]|jgi:tetratricopeptide (TPR) repeat protein
MDNQPFVNQTSQTPDLKKRRLFAYGILLLILILVGTFAVLDKVSNSPSIKYHGLNLTSEVEMDDATRTLLENRLSTEQSALASQIEAAGGKNTDADLVDWNLYELIAWDAYMLGDLVTAREIYEAYFELNTINNTAWNNYGNVLEYMGDTEKALDAYYQALTLSPMEEYYRDYLNLFSQDNEDGAKDQEILAILQDGVNRAGQTSWFMVMLAEWYLEHGDCESGLDHYEVAKSLDPENETLLADIATAEARCAE